MLAAVAETGQRVGQCPGADQLRHRVRGTAPRAGVGFPREQVDRGSVANVTHMRDGKITEFWTSTTDPQASIDFWA